MTRPAWDDDLSILCSDAPANVRAEAAARIETVLASLSLPPAGDIALIAQAKALEVALHERDRARAETEAAFAMITRIVNCLPPEPMEIDGKRYTYTGPDLPFLAALLRDAMHDTRAALSVAPQDAEWNAAIKAAADKVLSWRSLDPEDVDYSPNSTVDRIAADIRTLSRSTKDGG